MQQFSMCPFCTKVFDTTVEPSVRIKIDRQERMAYFKRVPVKQEQQEQRKEAAE